MRHTDEIKVQDTAMYHAEHSSIFHAGPDPQDMLETLGSPRESATLVVKRI